MTTIAAALLAVPLGAQSAPAPQDDGTVGPRELRDFSLPGTTPPPREQPEPEPEPAPSREPATARAVPPSPVPDPRPQARRPAVEPPAPSQPAPQAPQDLQSQPLDVAPPPADTPYVSQPLPNPAPLPAAPQPTAPQNSLSMLPWLVAALLSAATAAFFLYRRRARLAVANAQSLEAFVPSEAPPPPPPATRSAEPTTRSASPGLVSARLRPSIELEFTPVRAIIDERHATIEFSITAFNTGNAPARDVKLEVAMLNAGPAQDQEIARFFEQPVGSGNPLEVIAPMKHVNVNSRVSLPLDQVRAFEVAGRKLFVPMVAFNALYRGSGGEGQCSRSYLVGREGDGEKMAPFRLDLGPKIFRNLGRRPHHLKVDR